MRARRHVVRDVGVQDAAQPGSIQNDHYLAQVIPEERAPGLPPRPRSLRHLALVPQRQHLELERQQSSHGGECNAPGLYSSEM